jgi:hypothetical protein
MYIYQNYTWDKVKELTWTPARAAAKEKVYIDFFVFAIWEGF